MKKRHVIAIALAIATMSSIQTYQFKVINLAPDNYNKSMSAWPVEDATSKNLVASVLPFGAESAIDVPSAKVNKVVFAKAGNLFTQANKPVFLNSNMSVADRTTHVLSHGASPANTIVFANNAASIPASSRAKAIMPIPSSGAQLAIVPEASNVGDGYINNLPMKVIKKSELAGYYADWAAKMKNLYNIPVRWASKPSVLAVRDYADQVKNYLAAVGIKTTAFDALLSSLNTWLGEWERKEKSVQQSLAQGRLTGSKQTEQEIRRQMNF